MFKKSAVLVIAMAVLMTMFSFTAPSAFAAEKMIEAKITNMVESVDRNGNAYIRLIVEENRILQGVKYVIGVPVMAFGTNVEKARTLKIGDTLKALVQEREFNSRQSYTILAWL